MNEHDDGLPNADADGHKDNISKLDSSYEEWALNEITAGLKEAVNGNFASSAEVEHAFGKYHSCKI